MIFFSSQYFRDRNRLGTSMDTIFSLVVSSGPSVSNRSSAHEPICIPRRNGICRKEQKEPFYNKNKLEQAELINTE